MEHGKLESKGGEQKLIWQDFVGRGNEQALWWAKWRVCKTGGVRTQRTNCRSFDLTALQKAGPRSPHLSEQQTEEATGNEGISG